MLVNVTAPQCFPVRENDVLLHLRKVTDLGAMTEELKDMRSIRGMIAAATDEVDGPDGLLGRCLITQSWLLLADCFAPVMQLPLPPTQSVTSIRYRDSEGAWQTVPPTDYIVSGLGGSAKAEIYPAVGKSWPSHSWTPRSIEIQFVAGYGDEPEHVPAAIRQAILETIGTRFAFRESIVFGGVTAIPQSAVKALRWYRVFA